MLNVAVPFTSVMTVPPAKVALPLTTEAVTLTPCCGTALPAASRICTTGWLVSATPLCAAVAGCTLSVSCVAAPAPSASGAAASTLARPGAPNRSV